MRGGGGREKGATKKDGEEGRKVMTEEGDKEGGMMKG